MSSKEKQHQFRSTPLDAARVLAQEMVNQLGASASVGTIRHSPLRYTVAMRFDDHHAHELEDGAIWNPLFRVDPK